MTQAKDESGKLARDPEIVRAEAEIARTREAVAQSVTALQQEIQQTAESHAFQHPRRFVAAQDVIAALANGRAGPAAGAGQIDASPTWTTSADSHSMLI